MLTLVNPNVADILAQMDTSTTRPTTMPSCMREEFHELINHVHQMMFVSGETADVTPETTSMIESIVQQQVMEMVLTLRHPNLIS